MTKLSEITIAYVMIDVRGIPAKGEEPFRVAGEIAKLSKVHRVVVITGQYDLMATVIVDNNIELGNTVAAILGIEGVIETTTSVLVAAYDENGTLMVEKQNGP